jgi:integrase
MAKGNGSIFRPTFPPTGQTYAEAKAAGTLRESPTWWIYYYVDGKRVRESARTEKKAEALRLLAIRTGAAAKGEAIAPKLDRVRYEEARRDLVAHYETTKCRDLTEATKRLKHLDPFFTGRRIATIGPAVVTQYVQQRQAEDAANGTVNRETSMLSKMLRLAYRQNKLARVPLFDKLAEAAPRSGFFEDHQFHAVVKRLPEDLQVACQIMHTFGWRKMEVLDLERRQLDLRAGTLTLDVGSTKNDDGRTVYLTPELRVLLAAQVERVKALEKKLGRIIPCLFPHLSGGAKRQSVGARHVAVIGEPIRDFRRKWEAACKAAGVSGRLRHDLRRTAVRNMEQAGVPRSVAMKMTGHKTENIYRRYAIVSPADLKRGSDLIAQATK